LDEPIPLLIVDDHAMFREGLARSVERQPDMKIVGQCTSATEALAALDGVAHGVVLLDVDLGAERAMDFVVGAKSRSFEGQILIVTAGMSDQEAVRLVQAGVAGIIHKHNSIELLCNTIRQVARGEFYLENKYLGPLFRSADPTSSPTRPVIEERERTVLRLIMQGMTNREIGANMSVTEGAIKALLHQVFHKLGVRTRAQLVKVVLEQYRDDL
jgi:two-component system nitrate/nitrite response regulator NarL